MAGGGFIATSGHTTYEAVPNNTNPTWFKDPCESPIATQRLPGVGRSTDES